MKKMIGALLTIYLLFYISVSFPLCVQAETLPANFTADINPAMVSASGETTALPSGLILVANGSLINANAFVCQIKKITGDDGYYLNGRILARREDGVIEGGSVVARSLIHALMNSSVTVTINFKNDDSDGFLFSEHPGDYSTRGITMNSRTDSELLTCSFVHEMTHAFTDVFGLNNRITYEFADENDPDRETIQKDIERKYQEATAITVEQQFRKDMGYSERDTQAYGGIGLNDYACFPWNYTNEQGQVLAGVGVVYARVKADINFYSGPGIVPYLIDRFGYCAAVSN